MGSVIAGKLSDGQLADCALTIADLARIEEAFTRVLVLGVYHSRIEYPPIRNAGEALAQDGTNEPNQSRVAGGARGLADRAS